MIANKWTAWSLIRQDNVHTNTESVQCISIVYSICPYKYNQWLFRPVEKSNSLISNVARGKMKLAAFDSPCPKTPQRREKSPKNLLRKPNYSQFCPKFRCHGNGGRSGKNAIGSIRWPIPEKPLWVQKTPENLLRKPSYSQFCPKFRCHGNGGRSGKNAIGSIRWPIPENPPIGAKISQKSLTQAEL